MLTPGLLPLQAPGELGPPHRALERCPQGARFAPWMTLTLKVSFLGSLSWAFAGQERCVLSQAVPLGLGTGVGTSVGRAGERRGGSLDCITEGLRRRRQGVSGASTLLSVSGICSERSCL